MLITKAQRYREVIVAGLKRKISPVKVVAKNNRKSRLERDQRSPDPYHVFKEHSIHHVTSVLLRHKPLAQQLLKVIVSDGGGVRPALF